MPNQSLSSEISANISQFEALSKKDPTNSELNNKIQKMYDALQKAEGKEWEEQIEKYKEAKIALDDAKKSAQEAINDLSKTADAISKAASAIEKLLAALAFAL